MPRRLPSDTCDIEMIEPPVYQRQRVHAKYLGIYEELSSVYDNSGNQDNLVSNQPWRDSQYLLVHYGSDPSVTFIHFAALRGDLSLLELVVGVHTDSVLDATDEFGRCALHFAAHQGHHEIIEWLLNRSSIKPHPQLSLQDKEFKRTPLHEAVLEKHVDTVKLLTMEGADVNVSDVQGYSPLMMAHRGVLHYDSDSKCKYEQIVDILVTRMASIKVIDPLTIWSALLEAASLNSIKATESLLKIYQDPKRHLLKKTTPLHEAAWMGRNKILLALLKVMPEYIDSLSKIHFTPLHLAALEGNLEGVRALVDKGGNLAKQNLFGDTVIDSLRMYIYPSNLKDLFTDMLDTKVRLSEKTEGSAHRRAYNISLDLRILAPHDQPQMAVVSAMINTLPKNLQEVILQHPLVESYLGLKWVRLRFIFWGAIGIRAIFVIFLTAMVLVREDTRSTTAGRMLFFAVIPFCYNLIQFCEDPKRYCKRVENWLGRICTVISIAVAVAGEFNSTASWIPHLVSIAILLFWIQLMLLVGRLPACAFYAFMFFSVLIHVIKVLCVGMCIIIGFTLSFSVVFRDNDQFKTTLKTFVKTIVMMTGEYEYKDLFYPDRTNNSTTPKLDPEVTGSIILLSFIIIAGIVLMNLMIGLAVNDIQGLVAEGQFSRFVKQAEFIIDYEWMTRDGKICERLMPKCLKERLKSTIETIDALLRRLMPERLKKRLDSTIETEAGYLSISGQEPHPDISEKLVTDLIQLGLKNRKINTYDDV